MAKVEVIYNGSCPICSREIDIYRRDAARSGVDMRWTDLTEEGLPPGYDRDEVARRLHAVRDGAVLIGVPAFIAMWSEIPRWRWLARVVNLPVIRQGAVLVYDFALAPALYALHRRREARRNRLPS